MDIVPVKNMIKKLGLVGGGFVSEKDSGRLQGAESCWTVPANAWEADALGRLEYYALPV